MTIKQLLAICICVMAPVWVLAQECNDKIRAATPMSRFTLHGDGTATDSRSGLRWQRCPVGYVFDDNATANVYSDDKCELTGVAVFNWQSALQSAADLNDGGGAAGFSDWRVPNLKELVSILEFKCFGPAINVSLFPDTPPVSFWSSTTTNSINNALVVNFETAQNSFSYLDIAAFERHVRLVRGGG
ncbi:MAG: DUF1566 domain-containing protein [Woeseiaceae bacterium]